jgi:ribosome-binding protein aMBF1 (putative translation factor)
MSMRTMTAGKFCALCPGQVPAAHRVTFDGVKIFICADCHKVFTAERDRRYSEANRERNTKSLHWKKAIAPGGVKSRVPAKFLPGPQRPTFNANNSLAYQRINRIRRGN